MKKKKLDSSGLVEKADASSKENLLDLEGCTERERLLLVMILVQHQALCLKAGLPENAAIDALSRIKRTVDRIAPRKKKTTKPKGSLTSGKKRKHFGVDISSGVGRSRKPWIGQAEFVKALKAVESSPLTSKMYTKGLGRCKLCDHRMDSYLYCTDNGVSWPELMLHYVTKHNFWPDSQFIGYINLKAVN